ncbi:hypothetical protein [Methanobacterium alcaliphilum]|uniref:hypothetical protein n=1 Tax=Methanobacterium alcaliphilum TaxID=392018 RepID=UPI00200A1822|nr:hypothetical protein [Methanobacterium alcaliphilum]MCK9151797.1 hypothetical protein [Methanobacterium alcaliphilum]
MDFHEFKKTIKLQVQLSENRQKQVFAGPKIYNFRAFEIIGEATQNLPEDIKKGYPDIS